MAQAPRAPLGILASMPPGCAPHSPSILFLTLPCSLRDWPHWHPDLAETRALSLTTRLSGGLPHRTCTHLVSTFQQPLWQCGQAPSTGLALWRLPSGRRNLILSVEEDRVWALVHFIWVWLTRLRRVSGAPPPRCTLLSSARYANYLCFPWGKTEEVGS